MIDVCGLSFSYGRQEVLREVDLSIEAGKLYTVIGLNGTGKSTLFGCLTKLLNVPKGKVFVQGKDINSYSYREYSKLVSYVPQLNMIRMNDCIVRDYMVEGRTPYLSMVSVPGEIDYEAVENVAKRVGIEKFLGMPFSELSGGQQQLVSIARAMVQDTPILILDEPMSALDLCNQSVILRMINELVKEGRTILFSSHNPNHAIALRAGIVFMKNGKTMQQEYLDESALEKYIRDIYGDSISVTKCNNNNIVVFNIDAIHNNKKR